MRICIHSSNYDPAFHRIISGPYSSPESCAGPCGATAPTTTTATTAGPVDPNFNNPLPPIHAALVGVNYPVLYNINNFPVLVELQYQPVNQNKSDSLWSSVQTSTILEIAATGILTLDNNIIGNLFPQTTEQDMGGNRFADGGGWGYYSTAFPYIRARCVSKFAGNVFSSYSYNFINTQTLRGFWDTSTSTSNLDNIVGPSFFGNRLYNSNDFPVKAYVRKVVNRLGSESSSFENLFGFFEGFYNIDANSFVTINISDNLDGFRYLKLFINFISNRSVSATTVYRFD